MTSIEWLENKLNNVKPTEFCSIETIKEWVQQSKEMHKQEIIDAWEMGRFNIDEVGLGEEYYQETFVSKGSDEIPMERKLLKSGFVDIVPKEENHIVDTNEMIEDDVEKLAEELFPKNYQPIGRNLAGGTYDVDVNYEERRGFIKGYNKAKEHYELAASVRELKEYKLGFNCGYKQAKETLYTGEQVVDAILMAREDNNPLFLWDYTPDEIIQSLKQPKQ